MKITEVRNVLIENVQPQLDCGRYPIKREVGDTVTVSADIFRDGHGRIQAILKHRRAGAKDWVETPMTLANPGLDLWTASFTVAQNGYYEFTIEAFPDHFASWLVDTKKKIDARQDIRSDVLEGLQLIEEASRLASGRDNKQILGFMEQIKAADPERRAALVQDAKLLELMVKYPDRSIATQYERVLRVWVDCVSARYATWYELFPRSAGTVKGKSATFRDVEKLLPQIKDMGFDVIYFPPIHPIGKTNRKGPNNSLVAGPNDPGCPFSIGNEQGGHKAVDAGLGGLSAFERFAVKAKKMGFEIALDFALNCSPDHPYVKEHPEWFRKRPDGTIKFAENPPKKYEDIYPFNFEIPFNKALWEEIKSIIFFWIEKGVTIFRVDNPHTKPILFWEWLIEETHKVYPGIIFFAEAFTRPKVMKALAKAGFSQSYTYFTWRNTKAELIEYFEELTNPPVSDFFRGNLFANTPDILPFYLQQGGRPAFKIRAALAATLSSVYGIYSGFELCENRALPGREEYADSEKYECKVWDWNRPGNIKEYITKLNEIRRNNPALHEYDNLRFFKSENENILFFGKSTPDKGNRVLVIVNVDPYHSHNSWIYVPLADLGLDASRPYRVRDAITGQIFTWTGERNYVELDPLKEPAHVLEVLG